MKQETKKPILIKDSFAKSLGLRIVELRAGYCRTELPLRPDHYNPIGSIHGGVMYTVADTSAGTAMGAYGKAVTTLQGNLNYLAPAIGAEKLVSIAQEIKHGRNVSVLQIHIYDEKEKLLCEGTFTFFTLHNKKMDPVSQAEES